MLAVCILTCSLWWVALNLASYADDNTPDVAADSIVDAIRKLENDSMKLFEWFSDNKIKVKANCHIRNKS